LEGRVKIKPDPRQEELPLTAVMSHTLFPGRVLLRVAEVAAALRCDDEHVFRLVDNGRMVAVNIATSTEIQPGTSKTFRKYLRIPVTAWDQFINQSAT
jgi:hypothetical protein